MSSDEQNKEAELEDKTKEQEIHNEICRRIGTKRSYLLDDLEIYRMTNTPVPVHMLLSISIYSDWKKAYSFERAVYEQERYYYEMVKKGNIYKFQIPYMVYETKKAISNRHQP
ncbi:hypothetical protein JW756_00860 [Candidatus Woesearchaeota archaeon]|nr:hypothetical protein [Candidatus Woesearchaeota archaeon]